MSSLTQTSLIVLAVILAITFIGFGPIFSIWALNLLFGLTIPITFWTWLSTAWLHSIIVGSRVKFNSK